MNVERLSASQSKNSRSLSRYFPAFILVAAWIGMQLFQFFTQGIVTVNEAGKYIEQADILLETGSVSHPSLWLYSTEILLIAASKQLHAGFIPVVIIQLLVNAFATWYFYRLCFKLTNKTVTIVVTLLLILNAPFQSFNLSLYTESLFYSFTLVLSCFLLLLEKLTTRNFIFIILLLLLICFTRPTGLLFVPCVFLYLFFRFFPPWPVLLKAVITLGVAVLFLFILNAALGSGGELDFMLPFREEHIICGVPTVTDSKIAVTNSNSIGGILSYIIQHPVQFARLGWHRTLAFFGLMRPYYSSGHNLYLAFYFFPMYLLVLLSLRKWWLSNRNILLYCLSLILVTWASVILSCDDWHNRFFLSIVPYIYILTIPAIRMLADKLQYSSKPGRKF
jgi:hypothetical protein